MKKKRYPLLPALAVAALMLIPIRGAAQVFNPYSVSYTATYSNDNLTIGTDTLDGVVYSTVSYNDLYNDGEPGMPSLPVDFLKFSVPYNATDFTVSVNTRMWHTQTLDHLVYPSQMPWLLDGTPAPPAMLPDSAAYYSGNYYPSQMAWVADEGFLAGENHIVTVAVLPFRYTHTASTNQLSMVRRCGITLRYRLSDSLAMQPIVRNDSLLREEGYNLVQTMVVNPNSVKSYAPTLNTSLIDSIGYMHGIGGDVINGGGYAGGDGPGPVNPSLPDPGVDTTGISDELHLMETGVRFPYLIVTTSELKHAVRRIAALKRQKGYNVKVVTMDEVLSSQLSGFGDVVGEGHNARLTYTDEAGKLRQFIRNYYKYFGTKYVLLAGDVPYRIIDGKDFPMLTDLYFSDLSAGWQDKTATDRYPELYVGRIVANHMGSNHVEQINNYTEKLFRYELNPGKGDFSYLRNALFAQGREYRRYLNEVEDNLSQIYPNQALFHERYINNSLHPNGKDIIDTINSNPIGFLSIFNHADTTRTRIYGKDDNGYMSFIHATGPISNGDGLNCLKNKYYPFIYYSPACVTMPFDNKNKLLFGESFITGKDYGGPVYMGYTRSVYSVDAKNLTEAFSRRVKDGCVKLGIAFSMAKGDVVCDSLFTHLIQSYFGDPELELWTNYPQSLSGINITRIGNSITISRIPTDSTLVGYLSNDNSYKIKLVTNSDTTINDASSNGSIMVYKHNFIPYFPPLKLQNYNIEKSQYIIASDMTAGFSIDNKRDWGEVIVKSGSEYEIEASGTVRLEDGFKVEKGATFAVYPSCF